MTRVLIVGAGGLGRETLLYLRDMAAAGSALEVAGFLDDNPNALDGFGLDVSVVGTIDAYIPRSDEQVVVAIGDPTVRRAIVDRLAECGARFVTIVHPTAYVASGACLGEGCILAPFTFVGPGARLGRHVALNIYASVGHDATVGDYCAFSPYATINGNVRLGGAVFLGTHATVVLGVTVGDGAKISAGSVATRDIPARALVVGNPGQARVMF